MRQETLSFVACTVGIRHHDLLFWFYASKYTHVHMRNIYRYVAWDTGVHLAMDPVAWPVDPVPCMVLLVSVSLRLQSLKSAFLVIT